MRGAEFADVVLRGAKVESLGIIGLNSPEDRLSQGCKSNERIRANMYIAESKTSFPPLNGHQGPEGIYAGFAKWQRGGDSEASQQ